MTKIPGINVAYDSRSNGYFVVRAYRYIVIPKEHTGSWDAILRYAYRTYSVTGNDFIGGRHYIASTGAHVFKLDN